MSTYTDLCQELGKYFPVAKDVSVLASWEISYAEASRWAASGVPEATFTFPAAAQGCWALTREQSFWVCWLEYRDQAELIIRQHPDRSGYELLLVRRAKQ